MCGSRETFLLRIVHGLLLVLRYVSKHHTNILKNAPLSATAMIVSRGLNLQIT